MLSASHVDLSQAFCSYCGYPPMGPWRSRAHRVCMRCQLGIVLRAAPNAKPEVDEPFLIVDEELLVQAISHRAEDVLMVSEPDVSGVPMADFLRDPGKHAGTAAMAVDQAIAGRATPAIQLQTVSEPIIRLFARLALCGPPPAALLVLSVRGRRVRRSTAGRRAKAPDREVAIQSGSSAGG